MIEEILSTFVTYPMRLLDRVETLISSLPTIRHGGEYCLETICQEGARGRGATTSLWRQN